MLGCRQVQERNPESAERVPAFITAIYAMLHLAAQRSLKKSNQVLLPRPKWFPKKEEMRHSTGDLINNLKALAWTKAIGMNISGFVDHELKTQSQGNLANPCTSAMF